MPVTQDFQYDIKNALLNAYVEYYKVNNGGLNISSLQDAVVGKEKAVRVETNMPYNNLKILEYLVIHNDKAYYLEYVANIKDFNTYLPEFESIVKSFRFHD